MRTQFPRFDGTYTYIDAKPFGQVFKPLADFVKDVGTIMKTGSRVVSGSTVSAVNPLEWEQQVRRGEQLEQANALGVGEMGRFAPVAGTHSVQGGVEAQGAVGVGGGVLQEEVKDTIHDPARDPASRQVSSRSPWLCASTAFSRVFTAFAEPEVPVVPVVPDDLISLDALQWMLGMRDLHTGASNFDDLPEWHGVNLKW